jgi:hypothetical protein
MSHATRTTQLERPPDPSLRPTVESTAPGAECLLQAGEDSSPGSGVCTGLVLMALLAMASVFTVSMFSPGMPDAWSTVGLWPLPAAVLAFVLLRRSL